MSIRRLPVVQHIYFMDVSLKCERNLYFLSSIGNQKNRISSRYIVYLGTKVRVKIMKNKQQYDKSWCQFLQSEKIWNNRA